MKQIGIILLFLPLGLLAQEKKTSKPGWRAITSIGSVAGESATKPVFQLSGGIVYGRYFTGIGAGYDMYKFNSFPVFVDWRMIFGKKRIGFFYANGGYNFPVNYREETEFAKTKDQLKAGFYMDAGMGCRIPLGGLHRLSFSAGYSRKNMGQLKTYVYTCITSPCPEDIHDYKYTFDRIIAKISWELGK
ncbi:MAG: hypothetical protein ABIO81_11210 [Ginsengibacter sp.]